MRERRMCALMLIDVDQRIRSSVRPHDDAHVIADRITPRVEYLDYCVPADTLFLPAFFDL